MGNKIENISKILTYLENLDYNPSIGEIGRELHMHHDTVKEYLELIEHAQKELPFIEIVKTKNVEFIRKTDRALDEEFKIKVLKKLNEVLACKQSK